LVELTFGGRDHVASALPGARGAGVPRIEAMPMQRYVSNTKGNERTEPNDAVVLDTYI